LQTPSTFRDMVRCVSALGMINDHKWRWWVWTVADERPKSTGSETRCWVCIHQMNSANSCNDTAMITVWSTLACYYYHNCY